MKIVYLVTRAEPIGGAQVHVRDLATAMRAQGHAPTVVIGGSGPFIADLKNRGIPVLTSRHLMRPIRPWEDLQAFREVTAMLRQLKPDLLSTHGAKVGMLGRLAARSLGLPLIVTVHGWACAPGTPAIQAAVSRSLERLIGRLAKKVITVSDFDRVFGLKASLVSGEQVITVHNGMPDVPTRLRAAPEREPARLAMIARFEPQKDHETLLRALAALRNLPWELDLIGDGPGRQRMELLAADLGIRDRIRFLGQLSEVTQTLADAQVSLLISNWEGFPRSILESMRAGLPVIASSVGGVDESVRDGETGYLIPRGDVDLLRDRIGRLLASPALRSQLGAQGRARYEQNFTLEHLIAKTTAVYQELLGLHARPEAVAASPASLS
jgi:glycosyltransferase involved in cell wall biosynthesis